MNNELGIKVCWLIYSTRYTKTPEAKLVMRSVHRHLSCFHFSCQRHKHKLILYGSEHLEIVKELTPEFKGAAVIYRQKSRLLQKFLKMFLSPRS